MQFLRQLARSATYRRSSGQAKITVPWRPKAMPLLLVRRAEQDNRTAQVLAQSRATGWEWQRGKYRHETAAPRGVGTTVFLIFGWRPATRPQWACPWHDYTR